VITTSSFRSSPSWTCHQLGLHYLVVYGACSRLQNKYWSAAQMTLLVLTMLPSLCWLYLDVLFWTCSCLQWILFSWLCNFRRTLMLSFGNVFVCQILLHVQSPTQLLW
jgi:hypothetical protein